MNKLALGLLLAACGSSPRTTTPPPTIAVSPMLEPAKPFVLPDPPPRKEATEPVPAEPDKLPPGVEVSVNAERNITKGQEALDKNDLAAARAYFEFVISRFPQSKFRHEAELGLLDIEAAGYLAEGRDDVDTTNGYCGFIEHHPWHPRVVSGDLACRLNKVQHTPCDPKDTFARRYCGIPAYCQNAEAAKRPECKKP